MNEKAIRYLLIILVALLLVTFTLSFSYVNVGGGTCYCNSCSDCSNALADPACTEVILTQNIPLTSSGSYCVQGASYKTFNCNGYNITGDNSAGSIGIYFPKNTISFTARNCNIKNFERGIYINKNSQICSIYNTNISNVVYGVRIRNGCPYTTANSLNILNSQAYAINIPSGEYSTVKNIFIENAGNSQSYSALILSYAPFSIIENINIRNSYGGLVIDNSNNTLVRNITSYNTTSSSGFRVDLSSNVKVNGVNSSLSGSSAIYITASPNLTLNNSYSSYASRDGIRITASSPWAYVYNATTHDNTEIGISIGGDNSQIYEVTAYNSGTTGITLSGSSITADGLTTYRNNRHGLSLSDMFDSQIKNVKSYENSVTSSSQEGIYLNAVENITLINLNSSNQLGASSTGITLSNSSNITVKNALFENSPYVGIRIVFVPSEGNTFENITTKGNQIGFYASLTRGLIIKDSYIIGNSQAGISFDSSINGSLIYNNFFNNSVNVETTYLTQTLNFWNTSLKNGSNIVGGYLLGGNFWANPNGTGFSEICNDNDTNGICDSPYPLYSGDDDIDYYPLVINPSSPSYNLGNIFFVPPTPPNNTILYNRDYFEANATTNLTENYTKIVIHVYNFTSYYTNYECSSPPIKPCYTNFTSMPEGVYYLLAELYMINSTIYQSEVRTIAITNSSLFCSP